MKEPNQVEIQEVRTDMTITEPVGSLSKEDVQKLVNLVLQQLRQDQDVKAQHEKDTAIANRVFPPHVR